MGNRMRLPFFNLFVRRRRNRGNMWWSLLSLGIGAVIYGLTAGRRRATALPINNMFKNMAPKTNINTMDNAALTEFSEELLQSALNKNKGQ
jgi:hypothetical protein